MKLENMNKATSLIDEYERLSDKLEKASKFNTLGLNITFNNDKNILNITDDSISCLVINHLIVELERKLKEIETEIINL